MATNINPFNLTLDVFNATNIITGSMKVFPTVEDLACLSRAVYKQKFESKMTYDISKSGENKVIIKPLSPSWILIATAEYKVWFGGDGYNGAAYYNASTKHIVVAHRGTELSNLGSLWTDVKGVVFNGYTSQMKSAYTFTKLIVDKFWEYGISISVTGHSLGGWLSQTSAFFMKYQNFAEKFAGDEGHKLKVDIILQVRRNSVAKNSHHLHVVTFDSPGAFNIVELYLLKNIPRYSDDRHLSATYLDALDVSTYFSSPNAINSCNFHIGSLFVLPIISEKKGFLSWITLIQFLKYTFDSHNLKKLINFWQSAGFDETWYFKVTDWPVSFSETNKYHKELQCIVNDFTKAKFKIDPVDMNLFRMSIFDRKERDFLEDIHNLKLFGVEQENSSFHIIFKDKDITQANHILNVLFRDFAQSKTIFEFFQSFRILSDFQVVKVENQFDTDLFICLVKYFVKNTNSECDLPKLVKEVISDLPKVYQGIYQGFSKEYLSRIPDIIEIGYLTDLKDFLESSDLKIYQTVAKQSTLISVAKIIKVLKFRTLSVVGKFIKLNNKNSLFLNSDLLTILNRHVNISRIFPVEGDLKLILIENTSDQIEPTLQSLIDNVISSSPIIKLILVTPQKLHFQLSQSQISTYFLHNEVRLSDQTISFLDLSIDQQNKILDSEICFQGEKMPLKNLISLEELQANVVLDYIFLIGFLSQTNKICFGSDVPTLSDFEESYYIHRHFHRIIVQDPTDPRDPKDLLERLVQRRSVLVISYDGIDARSYVQRFIQSVKDQTLSVFEWHGNFEGFMPERHKVILVANGNTSATYHRFWSYFKTKLLRGYWLTYDGSWYWKATFGKPKQNLGIEYDERCNEIEIFQLQRPLVLIADEPGMGKSTLLKYFAQQCKKIAHEAGKTSWVVFIDLESCKQFLSPLETTSIDLGSAMNFLSSLDNSSFASSAACILNYLLHQEGRVTILIDGLDEVTTDIQSKIFKIVDELLAHTTSKVYIASRLHLQFSLESNFSTYINTFVPLEHSERIDFLRKFWINNSNFSKFERTEKTSEIVESYAAHLLMKLKDSLNITQADSFIGVPLQMFMLGTISLVQLCKFYSHVQGKSTPIDSKILDENTSDFGNIFRIYQTFVSEKIRISLEEKCKFKDVSEHYSWHNDILTESIIELYRKSSFLFLFPNATQVHTSDDILNLKEIQVLLSVGIVSSHRIDINSIQFIHRSLAEYFAADFLVSRLIKPHLKDSVLDFLKKNIFIPNFDKIRFFLDHFISKQPCCDAIFGKCLEWRNEKLNIFETLEDSKKAEVRDLLGRNVLHYAICYGDHKSGILWILIQNQQLFNETDVFGCSFISYAALLPHLKDIIQNIIALDPVIYKHDWIVTVPNLIECFHSDLLSDVKEIDHFTWTINFSGEKVCRLNEKLVENVGRISFDSIRSELEEDIRENQQLFRGSILAKFSQIIRAGLLQLPTDLTVVIMRGYCESDTVKGFIRFLCDTANSEKYLEAFEMAMRISGYGGVKVAELIYEFVRNEALAEQMLNVMARNDFALLKSSMEFFEAGSVIDIDIWMYCKDRKQEMFEIIAAAKFRTLHRAFYVINHFPCVPEFVDDFLLFCQKLQDENIEKTIVEIIREDNCRIFIKVFQFRFYSIWNFLPTREVRGQVLEMRYDDLKESTINDLRTNFSNSYKDHWVTFLMTIYDSVGSDWQNKIINDVKVDLEELRSKATLACSSIE